LNVEMRLRQSSWYFEWKIKCIGTFTTYATYLCTLLGFVTRNGFEAGDKDSRYIVFDGELLAQKRAQYCEIPGEPNVLKNKGSVTK